MLMKWMNIIYEKECNLFYLLNSLFERKKLNTFFRHITHLGGARMTISITMLILLFSTMPIRLWGIQSAVSLAGSHLLVALIKKVYPRNRPYLSLAQARVLPNPLKDHSFPSGHSTAIFSLVTPYIIHVPSLAVLLLPAALCVGFSRIFLGLHYPSDVLVGSILGTMFGILAVWFI
jgi:undecaprenyl-diphosphatase